MCGRYTLTSQQVIEELALPVDASLEASEWWRPRFNIAPTQPAPVVRRRTEEPSLEMMRWGLMPPWAKDLSESSRRINARAETAATAHAFRDAMRHRRCLVLADGFYEWRGEGKLRVPFYLRPAPTRLITFAGLWERWKSPSGDWLLSFAILTGPANQLVAEVHDRMPLIVAPAHRSEWMSPDETDPLIAMELIKPWSPTDWVATEVSRHVNRPQNDDPLCIEPASP